MSDIFAPAQELEGAGRFAEAVREYTRLIDGGEGGSVALMRRGLLHNQLGSFARMTEDLEQAERVGPDDPYPWMWQGHIAKAMRRPLFAAYCLRAALDHAPPAFKIEMRINLAELLVQAGWLDEAAHLARAVPPDVRDWWAGTRRTALDRYAEAHASTLALLASDRGAPGKRGKRIPPLLRRACRTPAMVRVRSLLRGRPGREPSPATRLDLAERLWSLGRLRPAAALCRALIEEQPDDFAAPELLSRVIARAQGAEAALAYLQSLGSPHQGAREWTKAVARLLHDLGRFDEAIALIDRFGPQGHEELLILSGLAHIAIGHADRLDAFCREWMLSTPESVPAGGFLVSAFYAARGEEREVPSVSATAQRLRMVHFWNSVDVPGDVRDTIASWQRHHPQLDTTLFNTQTAADFIHERYGSERSRAFAECRHPAMQADVFRIAFLGEEGGLYADADELCLAPMDAVLAQAAKAEIAAIRSGETPNFLHNYFMGSRAGSPTFQRALVMATDAIMLAAQQQRSIDIWHCTGPGLVTRAAGLTIAERFDTIDASEIALVPMQQYRAFTRVHHELAYKQQPSTNWRLS